MRYRELEDRKILQARDAVVLEVRADPQFFLQLSNGIRLEYSGTVRQTIGPGGAPNAAPRPLSDFNSEELVQLLGSRPLSWVIFNSGAQRIVFSNKWHLAVSPGVGDSWNLDFGDGQVLSYPL